MRAKAIKDLECGMIVTAKMGLDGIVRVKPFSSGKPTYLSSIDIGLAARNIKKGELIEWNPSENTKDVIIQGTIK